MRISSRIRHGLAPAVAVAMLFALPAPALAAGNLNAYISSMTPAQNTALPLASGPTFEVVSSCKGMELQAYVSRSDVVDGELAFLAGDIQEQLPMAETSFGSGVYQGVPRGTWLQQAGQYYWQVRAQATCNTVDGKQAWASVPIGIQVVGQAQDNTTTDVVQQDNGELLSIAQARVEIAPAIKKAKKRVARGLKRTCTRRSSGSILAVVCSASWNDRKQYTYNGLFRMALNDDGTVEATFNGRRALLSCIKSRKAKRKSSKSCFKRHNFSATVG